MLLKKEACSLLFFSCKDWALAMISVRIIPHMQIGLNLPPRVFNLPFHAIELAIQPCLLSL